MRIRRLDLEATGIARVVGELEARILEILWDTETATVKGVNGALGDGAHLKTTMTVMNRLVDKGYLYRERKGRAYQYTPAMTRENFSVQITDQVLTVLTTDFGRPTLAQFVESVDDGQLAELEELIRKRRDGDPV